MATESTYVPGVCNINTKEIAQRRKAGYFGLGLTIVLAAILFAFSLGRYYRITLCIPLFIATIGFLQAKNRFCVGYASTGQQNAKENSEKASVVIDKKALSADKKRARIINLRAALIAILVTLLFILI